MSCYPPEQPQCGPPDENAELTCWCGARGTIDELFSDDLEPTCGGSGVLHCYCGGDFCVCHYHGVEPCDGCEDCGEEWDENFDEDDYDPRDHEEHL